MNQVYLDYNATAPLRPEAREAMLRVMDGPHNASAVHAQGRAARQMVEQAREHVSALVGAPPAQVIFNSGATEGNNTVLRHFAGEKILVSAIEHPSVLEAAPGAPRIPVTPNGIIDLVALEALLKKEKPALISVMLVNNETGIIQPVAEAAALAKQYGALVHCDAVQAAGRIPVNIETLRVDFLTISSHKLGGPQGAGALVLGLCGITPTLLHGGGQEKNARAGTENVAAIAGFGAAAQASLSERAPLAQNAEKTEKTDNKRSPVSPETLGKYLTSLEDALCKMQQEMGAPPLVFYGQNGPRIPNTTMFSTPGTRAESLLMSLDLEGIAVSNGSACTSGAVQPSHVLQAMGADETEAASALRISMGWATTEADIERFLEAWSKIQNRINRKDQTENA